ncbi:type II toxin-antitoxin system RelE/ParE family toxin [Plastoroseomonas hellenica]|uniref:type II toxin-antitoxin system RelE/ParE family toxin n=1 Tax=Plastoroseomonas hellenica TaxID=2687306 RepID=UPI001BAAE25D|nr:type II toxin-antitoxin system RelE/ParE family toxin [Plastoroseomonas hellenica]
MSEEERAAFVTFIAANPLAGDVVPGTGGARKVRWARPGMGKSGGYRVVTYFGGTDIPLFLITVYTKNVRANLTQAERNEMREILGLIAEAYRRGAKR